MTHNAVLLKTIMTFLILALLVFSIVLWKQTPDLFEYFNQAFCAHQRDETLKITLYIVIKI